MDSVKSEPAEKLVTAISGLVSDDEQINLVAERFVLVNCD
jgi:hypothetical protein